MILQFLIQKLKIILIKINTRIGTYNWIMKLYQKGLLGQVLVLKKIVFVKLTFLLRKFLLDFGFFTLSCYTDFEVSVGRFFLCLSCWGGYAVLEIGLNGCYHFSFVASWPVHLRLSLSLIVPYLAFLWIWFGGSSCWFSGFRM